LELSPLKFQIANPDLKEMGSRLQEHEEWKKPDSLLTMRKTNLG
jgi:hypothetical protein